MTHDKASARTHLHTRQIQCSGYLREDGFWEIEASIVDTKPYKMRLYDGRQLPVGQPVHEMHVSIVVDDEFQIHDAQAVTKHAPLQRCIDINGAYRQLIGLRMGPGFLRRVHSLFGAGNGCTHITDLLGPLAVTTFQTIALGRRQTEEQTLEEIQACFRSIGAQRLVDSCHGWRRDGEAVAVIFPQSYCRSGEHESDGQTDETM